MTLSTPIRVQLKREKGWRLPEGVHIADRRTVFGNPFKVWRARGAWFVEDVIEGEIGPYWTEEEALAVSLALYREYLHDHPEIVELARGKSLACWCRIGRPCHADILIDIANRGVVRDG